jgi:hypothetical protein
VVVVDAQTSGGLPLWIACGYPLLLALAAGTYGQAKRDRLYQVAAACDLAASLAAAGAKGYDLLRPHMPGLDKIVIGLLFFLCAIATSLYKAGQLQRLIRRLLPRPPAAEAELDGTQ